MRKGLKVDEKQNTVRFAFVNDFDLILLPRKIRGGQAHERARKELKVDEKQFRV